MTAACLPEDLSVDDYLSGEAVSLRKYEYVTGRAYMMAGGRNQHNALAVAFIGIMFGKLRGKKCQPFNSDTKLRVRSQAGTSFYYPDAMVVCQPNAPQETFQDNPVVIAEVLSASTRRIDEGEKRQAYLGISTLSVYLLVEATRPLVRAYQRTATGGFAEHVYTGFEAVIDLPAIGVTLPLADLYERVDFDAAVEDERAEQRELGFDD